MPKKIIAKKTADDTSLKFKMKQKEKQVIN
jgi:hypothetical protein